MTGKEERRWDDQSEGAGDCGSGRDRVGGSGGKAMASGRVENARSSITESAQVLWGMQHLRLSLVVRATRDVDKLTCGCCGLVRMWLPFVAEMCLPSKRRCGRSGDLTNETAEA